MSNLEPVDNSGILADFFRGQLQRNCPNGDIYELGNFLRIYKAKYQKLNNGTLLDSQYQEYRMMERFLLPWLIKVSDIGLEEISSKFKSKCIVVGVGNRYAKYAIHSIKVIRMLGCQYPIEVFYNGEKDLDIVQIAYLKKMTNVKVIDIRSLIDMDLLGLESWDIKPFMMLLSSFAEVLLIDADTIFLQNPEVMFHDPGYLRTGALYFYDRTISAYNDKSKKDWLRSILPRPLSPTLLSSRYYNEISGYEQDSGVVLINKQMNLFGLLGACLLNAKKERQILHEMSHGDKESFWIGFELAGDKYEFVPTMSGSIGKSRRRKNGKQRLCGKLLHFDRDGELLWFNDGITTSKRNEKSEPFKYFEYGMEKPGKWDGLCLEEDVHPIKEKDASTLKKIVAIFERNPLDMDDVYAGQAMFNLA
jgi:hypothetical protein